MAWRQGNRDILLLRRLMRKRFSQFLNSSTDEGLRSRQSRIRNIGLVAHIDAGKTTTTERMLFYSGSSKHMGEVHHGDTVMDFMEQERERGITISMASATINWLGFHINLIDTPGHVDFTFEVERSLSVLDGAIIILDGSEGVQAQTIKVWQQARRFQIPTIFYVNKMDKSLASVDRCLSSLEKKLSIQPLQLQIPIRNNSILNGIIDLVSGNYMEWSIDHKQRSDINQLRQQNLLDRSKEFLSDDIASKLREELLKNREKLIEKLCDYDDVLADYVLSQDDIIKTDRSKLMKSIRELTINRKLFPVLLGSSYRNIGVESLLDSICYYLPKPLEREHNRNLYHFYMKNSNDPHSSENLCALAFKIHFHPRLGLLTYIRIYSGSLYAGDFVFNLNRKIREKIVNIYRVFADQFVEIGMNKFVAKDQNHPDFSAGLGDIVAVSGLSSTITGDTLVHNDFRINQYSTRSTKSSDTDEDSPLDDERQNYLMAGIRVPEPVYYCSLESPSLSKMKQLNLALDHLQREDPSFKVVNDSDNQQIIVKGMGNLHIEIIKERIKREYQVEVESGPLQISYKESIATSCKKTLELSKSIEGTPNFCKICLEVRPNQSLLESGALIHADTAQKNVKHNFFTIKYVNTKEYNIESDLKPWQTKAINVGIKKTMEYGPLLSFPVIGVEVLIYQFETTNKTSNIFISNVVKECLVQALRASKPILLEPIMKIEIVTDQIFLGPIISDLVARRGQLLDSAIIESDTDEIERSIKALTPLSEMFDYSTFLRTISSGQATFDISLHSYQPVDESTSKQIVNKIQGIY